MPIRTDFWIAKCDALARNGCPEPTIASRLRQEEWQKHQSGGPDPKFLEFEQKLKQAASHNRASVLIRGERGSGKELAAYGIHYFSKRREGPFVSVLTPAITESLQADELFGHERSSFTGADKVRKGKFLIAEDCTVFLDEVGNLPLHFSRLCFGSSITVKFSRWAATCPSM